MRREKYHPLSEDKVLEKISDEIGAKVVFSVFGVFGNRRIKLNYVLGYETDTDKSYYGSSPYMDITDTIQIYMNLINQEKLSKYLKQHGIEKQERLYAGCYIYDYS